MKNNLLSGILMLICGLIANDISARNPYGKSVTKQQTSYKTEAGNCSTPVSQFALEINNVRTRLLDAGDMWWDLHTSHYEVPKGTTSGVQYPQAIFSGAIWVSGLDQGGNLKIAAGAYRYNGVDYWSGPLDNAGTVTSTTCNVWDQHFNVLGTEIDDLRNLWAISGGLPLDTTNIALNILHWPARGNPSPYVTTLNLGGGNFAPFYDNNGDGIYDPTMGDYPTIKMGGSAISIGGCGADTVGFVGNTSYADQMVFWIMNDVGNIHSTGGQPIGIQINSLAYAFTTTDEVNDMTFYNYQLINKSGAVLNQTCISQYTDPDLGCSENDRMGCDTSRNLAIVYNGYLAGGTQVNGYTSDQGIACLTGYVGYGSDLPMLGIQFLQTPADTGINIITHQPKQLGMTSFGFFGLHSTAADYRSQQIGLANNYIFPGDPSIATQPSECNPQGGPNIPSGDRRMVQTSGPFTFLPCASQFLSLAVIFKRPVNSNCPSWAPIDSVADKAQTLFNNGFRLARPTAINDIAQDPIRIYPNPTSSFVFFQTRNQKQIDKVFISDIEGRIVLSQVGNINAIDMSALPTGVYLVKANQGNKQSVIKVVKE